MVNLKTNWAKQTNKNYWVIWWLWKQVNRTRWIFKFDAKVRAEVEQRVGVKIVEKSC